MPRGDEDVHRPDALELVRPGGRVGGGREEGEVDDGVGALGGEDLGEARLGRRLGEVDVVEAGLVARRCSAP